jgi:hypothetical protein
LAATAVAAALRWDIQPDGDINYSRDNQIRARLIRGATKFKCNGNKKKRRNKLERAPPTIDLQCKIGSAALSRLREIEFISNANNCELQI